MFESVKTPPPTPATPTTTTTTPSTPTTPATANPPLTPTKRVIATATFAPATLTKKLIAVANAAKKVIAPAPATPTKKSTAAAKPTKRVIAAVTPTKKVIAPVTPTKKLVPPTKNHAGTSTEESDFSGNDEFEKSLAELHNQACTSTPVKPVRKFQVVGSIPPTNKLPITISSSSSEDEQCNRSLNKRNRTGEDFLDFSPRSSDTSDPGSLIDFINDLSEEEFNRRVPISHTIDCICNRCDREVRDLEDEHWIDNLETAHVVGKEREKKTKKRMMKAYKRKTQKRRRVISPSE